MIRLRALPVVALLTLAAPAVGQGQALAVVLQAEGPVQVIREVRDTTGAPTLLRMPARVGTRLLAGDRVEPQAGGSLTVIHRTGEAGTLGEPAFMEAPDQDTESELFGRTVSILSRAAAASARTVPNRQGWIRPAPGAPVSPRNGVLVMEAQPRLRWLAVDGAPDYTVQIRTPGEATVRYTAADTSLVVPRALSPGTTYHWRVEAGGSQGPETSFRTISDAEATTLVEGLADLRARGFDPEGAGRLLKVMIFADLELFYAALSELVAVEAGAGPPGPDLLLLKGEILDRLGWLEEARRAFDRAEALGSR